MSGRKCFLYGVQASLVLCLSLILASCGDRKIQTGIFLDSAVEGLIYTSDSISGVTGESGEFDYRVGERVSFYLNELLLGSAEGDSVITPLDLVEDALGVTDNKVTNIARLLQSLDENSTLSDGIQLLALALSTPNADVNLSLPQLMFDTDPGLQAYLGIVKPGDSGLVSITDAQDHLRESIDDLTSVTPLSVVATTETPSVVEGDIVRLSGEITGTFISSRWEQDENNDPVVELSLESSDPDDALDSTEVEFTAPDVNEETNFNFTFIAVSENSVEFSDTIRISVIPSVP